MSKLYKARKWLVNKLGGAMLYETMRDRKIIREFEHPTEKVRATGAAVACEVRNVPNTDDYMRGVLTQKIAVELEKRRLITFRQRDLPDGSREYAADLYVARVNDDG